MKRFLKCVKDTFKILLLTVAFSATLLCSFGFSYTGDVVMAQNGKVEATLTVKSDKTKADFEKSVAEKIEKYNEVAGLYPLTVTLESVVQQSEGYQVNVSTRRIDKLKTSANFYLQSFQEYVEENSQTREKLDKLERGNLSTVSVSTSTGRISFLREGTSYPVLAKKVDGTPITVEELSKGENVTSDAKLLLFEVMGVEGLESVSVTLPGKVLYIGGNSVTVSGENTLTIKPEVVKNAKVFDNATNEYETKDVVGMVGYVVFDPPVSPWLIGVICVASGVVVLIATVVCIRLYRSGKKILAAQTGDKEVDNGEN